MTFTSCGKVHPVKVSSFLLFVFLISRFTMEVEEQDNFAAMRQKRIDQMAKMHHKISSPKLRELLKEVRTQVLNIMLLKHKCLHRNAASG